MNAPRQAHRPLPWRVGDLLAVYGVNVAAAIVIVIAWWGTSGTAQLSTQVAWTNVGVSGLILAGIGNSVWLMTGRRSVGERRQSLLPNRLLAAATEDGGASSETAPTNDTFVSARGMTRFHLVTCPLVEGKRTRRATRSAHERAGRRPCGICET